MTSADGSKRVLIVSATLNERANIDRLCEAVLGLPMRPHLLVVDDNSSDGTGQRLRELAQENEGLIPIHRPRKLGLGSAHMLGMMYAIQNGYDVLVTMDADFSHDPADIPRLVSALDGADFVIGSRYMPGGSSDYEGYRHIISTSANRLARALLGIPLHEFTTSFRAFRTNVLSELDLGAIRSQGYSFFMESLWHIARTGHRVNEVPIHFADRVHGESKIPRYEIFSGGRKLLSLFFLRLFGRKRLTESSESAGPCPVCKSDFRLVLYPETGARPPEGEHEAYRCTSLEHRSRPQVARCLACGLATAGKTSFDRPHQQEYEDVIDEEYLENDWVKHKTFGYLTKQVSAYVPAPGKVLEVGAYCGVFMDEAKKAGWDIVGIEPSRWASDIARSRGHNVMQGTLADRAGGIEETFDTIVLWDVIEHLEDPVTDLRLIRSKLRDDGTLCVSTINMDGWFAQLLGRRWPWIMHMHLYYFTTRSLVEVLNRAGFTLVEELPYRHFASVRYVGLKAGAILPVGLSNLASLVARLIPKRIVLPIYLGDVKLYIAKPTEPPQG